MKTNELKTYHKNPRKISDKEIELLKRDLEELGDLSGIIHDINTNEIIGGNQRTSIFNKEEAEIIIEKEYEKPTKTGSVAKDHVLYKGEEFTYRKVDWTKEQCEKANIVANKAGGDWDFDILAIYFEKEKLLNYGFLEHELDLFISDEQSDSFSLKDGEKSPFQQITFTLSDEQAEQVKNAIEEIKKTDEFKYCETYGNENNNGNAIYLMVREWYQQKK